MPSSTRFILVRIIVIAVGARKRWISWSIQPATWGFAPSIWQSFPETIERCTCTKKWDSTGMRARFCRNGSLKTIPNPIGQKEIVAEDEPKHPPVSAFLIGASRSPKCPWQDCDRKIRRRSHEPFRPCLQRNPRSVCRLCCCSRRSPGGSFAIGSSGRRRQPSLQGFQSAQGSTQLPRHDQHGDERY